MEKAEQGQAKYVRLADRAARFYTPAVHTLAAATFLGWWIFGEVDIPHAILLAVTVLIITCPCVITSYSIHYTKLYDYVIRAMGGVLYLTGALIMAYNFIKTVKGEVRRSESYNFV